MGSVSIALPYVDRWYFSEILAGAQRVIEGAGHTVIVHVIPPSSTSTAEAADALEHDLADPDTVGALVAGFKYRPDQSSRALGWGRPLVAVGGVVSRMPTAMIDDTAGARAATNHLLKLGHTRIAHLAGDIDEQMDFSVNGRRAKGYRVEVESKGFAPDIHQCEFDVEQAYAVSHAMLEDPERRPTAVFAVSDEMALPLLAAARDLGLVIGKDLSVVGFDDHPDAAAAGLTTIRQVPSDLGAAAAGFLIEDLANGLDAAHSRLLPTSLIERTSTGRPVHASRTA